jgi:glycosyltransferase involved in cell wall biosynthesis
VANGVSYRRLAHRVLANSEAVGRRVWESEGVAPERVIVVPNFLEAEAFKGLSEQARLALRGELHVPRDAIVVGCVARLRSEKNLPMLLRGVHALRQRIPQLHAVLIGDGPSEGELRALATQLEIAEQVHFAGYRPNRPNPHSLFDISVLCSEREGFPNSIIEAMAVARPVVATSVGGVPDVVQDGRTGFLVNPGDDSKFVESVEHLASDPTRRRLMGAAGRAVVEARYGADTVLGRLAELYETARGTTRAR